MGETKQEEHDRLQGRTDELKEEHAALARDKTPFDQADHDAHTAHLQKHGDDLATHQRRIRSDPDDDWAESGSDLAALMRRARELLDVEALAAMYERAARAAMVSENGRTDFGQAHEGAPMSAFTDAVKVELRKLLKER